MIPKNAYVLSSVDLAWVREHHSALMVREKGRLLRGPLQFKAYYEDRDKRTLELEDEYMIEMYFDHNFSGFFPRVWEIGGRLQKRADDLGKPLIDMHVYSDSGEICMGTKPTMIRIINNDPSIKGVFHNLIIRYFYYHTYWERCGREPWPGLAHDIQGFCQDYLNNREKGIQSYLSLTGCPKLKALVQRKFGKKTSCICRRRKTKHCNCGAMKGLKAMQKDYVKMQRQNRLRISGY